MKRLFDAPNLNRPFRKIKPKPNWPCHSLSDIRNWFFRSSSTIRDNTTHFSASLLYFTGPNSVFLSRLSARIWANIFVQICYTNLPLWEKFSLQSKSFNVVHNVCANLYNKIEDDFFNENCIYNQENTNLLWCTERSILHGSQTLPFPLYLKQIIITMKAYEICSFLIKRQFPQAVFPENATNGRDTWRKNKT